MFELCEGEYISGISFYREGEKGLDGVGDEVERGEF